MASVQAGDCVSRAYGSAWSTSRHASRGAGLIAELIEGHRAAMDAAHRPRAALCRAETSAPVPPDPPAPDRSVALPAEEPDSRRSRTRATTAPAGSRIWATISLRAPKI